MSPVRLVMSIGFALSLAAQAPETYKVRLSPVPVEAKTRADIAGIGAATATLSGSKLSITGTFEGLPSAAVDAKVHQGPVTGVHGPAILDIKVAHATSGMLSASLDLTPQQIESLKKGKLYIQIDSERAPDGNLWGWFLR
ncbi:MAG TPA: CHRD domain-containing protein [Bryobacteraceae bacterium]|nr:CHRD domain-containing protein [Bryobacteraceae bacterium]